MGYASRSGRARTSARSPQAHAICDRCGARVNFVDLDWQFQWGGASLINLRLLVCRHCKDVPQEQLRAIVLPADPLPIINARPQDFTDAETDYRSLSAPTVYDPTTGIPIPDTDVRVTQDGSFRTTQPIGAPNGLEPGAVMPLAPIALTYGTVLPILSVTSIGTTVITATCSAPHGLSTGSQVSAEGLSETPACGFYTVTVTTATAFTWAIGAPLPIGSLLTSTTRIITVLAGLPIGYTQIPLTGA